LNSDLSFITELLAAYTEMMLLRGFGEWGYRRDLTFVWLVRNEEWSKASGFAGKVRPTTQHAFISAAPCE
jgi:hypothetical protein